MGCDIHFTIECKPTEDDGWVGVYSTCLTPAFTSRGAFNSWGAEPAETRKDCPLSYENMPTLKDRHYEFFGKLAGVRGDGPGIATEGLPDDASELSRVALNQWSMDAHSIHHCSLAEFAQAYADTDDSLREHLATVALKNPATSMPLTAEEVLFGDYHGGEALYRVVFWFDN